MAAEVKTRTDAFLWEWASRSGLETPDLVAVTHLLQNHRKAVIQRLQELLSKGASAAECKAAASAIGTLTELGKRVPREAKSKK